MNHNRHIFMWKSDLMEYEGVGGERGGHEKEPPTDS